MNWRSAVFSVLIIGAGVRSASAQVPANVRRSQASDILPPEPQDDEADSADEEELDSSKGVKNTPVPSAEETAADIVASRQESALDKERLQQMELRAFQQNVLLMLDLQRLVAVTPIDSNGTSSLALKSLQKKCREVDGRLDGIVSHLLIGKLKASEDPTIDKAPAFDAIFELLQVLGRINPQLRIIAGTKYTSDPRGNQKLASDLQLVRQLTRRIQRLSGANQSSVTVSSSR